MSDLTTILLWLIPASTIAMFVIRMWRDFVRAIKEEDADE